MGELPDVPAERVAVTTTYHGVEVTEDYRWLEDPTAEETVAWTKAQQDRTQTYFDGIPWRGALRSRVEELLKSERTTYQDLRSGGELFFALKLQTPRQQPFLVALTGLDDITSERVVVDPVALDPSGETAIDFFVPSPDGTKVAVSLSEHGSEDGTLHIFDVESGKVVSEPIPHVNLMGGSVAWRHDSGAFWYTLCAEPAGFRQQVWFRDLEGGPDRLDVPNGFADERIAENFLSASRDGWLMDRVQKGDGGEWQIFLRRQADQGDWWQVADIPDKCVRAAFGADGLYFLCRRDAAHGKVLRLIVTEGATVADSDEVVPTSDKIIEDFAVTSGTIWVVDMDGGPQQVRAFESRTGASPAPVEIPPLSSVSSYSSRLSTLAGDRVAWLCESFTEPPAWWVVGDREAPRRTALTTTTPLDLSGYTVTREFATSKDGTRVPLNVIAAPGTPRDGTAPALLTAYGGYAISLVPHFDPKMLLWLERGGVYVVANIRGGGEYGEEWHHAGRLATKQNCFDDFIACADHLVSSGITSRERLAVQGGSNGGMLMGAVLTQRPDIAAAVVAAVPVLDALRSETTTNGKFNTTEYGSVDDEEMFRAMRAYSPYHNVEDGAAYPSVLLTAGENDMRVDAWHAKKMAARLQAATSSDRPVLLLLESSGHLSGSLDQIVDNTTDWHAFAFNELGVGWSASGV